MAYCQDDKRSNLRDPVQLGKLVGDIHAASSKTARAFSKKVATHAHMMAIYFVHYIFVRYPSNLEAHASDGRWRHVEALGNVRYGKGA
jgi:hypothetical protein